MPALVLLAAGYVLGVIAGAVLGGPWWLTTVVAGCLALALAIRAPSIERGLLLVAVVLIASGGHARIAAVDAAPPPPIATYEGRHEVTGVIAGDPTLSGLIARFDLTVEAIDDTPIDGRIRVTMPAPIEPLRGGERLVLSGDLGAPPDLEEFDYAAHLRTRGIHRVLSFPAEWERLGTADEGWRAALQRFRRWGMGNIERSLPDPAATIAVGVLFGEQRAMAPDVIEALRVTGTTHLVVVSGLHVAMTLGFAIALLTPVMSRRHAAVLVLALLPPYLLIVGLDPPVVRASIMAVGVVIAALLGRRTPGWIYLIYALALMLAWDPALIRTAAFQFSAAATAGVMLIAPVLRDWILVRAGWTEETGRAALVEAGATAAGASLAVMPVQVAAFEYVSLWEVPTNILITPLFEGTLVVAALAAFTGWWTPAAEVLGTAGSLVPDAFLAVIATMAGLPSAAIPVTAPLPAGFTFYAVLLGSLWWLERTTGPAPTLDPGRRSGLEWTVPLTIVAGGLWFAVLAPGDDLVTVTILDVGQGSAALIQDGNTRVLVDTGTPDGVVVPALHRNGARGTLDAVILSHEDADHAGGLHPVLRRMDVRSVLASSDALNALDVARGQPLTIGDRVHVSERVVLEVLAPPSNTRDRRHASPNEASLVLLVTAGERRILLPGDIESGAEEWMVRSAQAFHADVIAVPHHGSRTSSTPAFVEAVAPAVAVASVGLDNRYGHPHEEVVQRYADALFLRTDESGDVTVRTDGVRLWVQTER
jgi:competence protein ComEC